MTVLETQDLFVRALCIWREMRGESEEARLACYWVICNRTLDPQARWPRSIYGTVTQKYQFASFTPGDPNASLFPRESNPPDWQAWLEICALCDNPGPDPVSGANLYEACNENQPKPGWAHSTHLVKQIGNTRFYRI